MIYGSEKRLAGRVRGRNSKLNFRYKMVFSPGTLSTDYLIAPFAFSSERVGEHLRTWDLYHSFTSILLICVLEN